MPIIVIPDPTPLIHLAAGDALWLFGGHRKVVIPDVVVLEATRLPEKPWAAEVAAWLRSATVEPTKTELGDLYRIAIEQEMGAPALVVFEDARVPRMLDREVFRVDVAALTTRNFLELAEERRLIESAEAVWRTIETAIPTASPLSRRRTRKSAYEQHNPDRSCRHSALFKRRVVRVQSGGTARG